MMKRQALYILLALLVFTTLRAQVNLVPNPSFEDCDTACSKSFFGQPILQNGELVFKPYIQNWFYTKATPDIFRYITADTSNNGGCWGPGGFKIPNSAFGFQYPRTDSTYIGLFIYWYEDQNTWAGHTYNYREWAGVKLSDTLKQGRCYEFTMYVSRGEKSNRIVSSIGAFFSADSLYETVVTTDTMMSYLSPWPIDSHFIQVQHNPWETIYDTSNWIPITGRFKATGNEVYMYLGNFLPDNQYPIVEIDTLVNNPLCNLTYFFIDDVSLYEIEEPCGVGINENATGKINVYPNPAKDLVSIDIPENINQAQLSIYNLTGQLVLQKQITQANQTIAIPELSNGMYIFVVQIEDRVIGRQRVVISE